MKRRMMTLLLLIAAACGMPAPKPADHDDAGRVIVLGIDGLDPRAVAEFGRDGDLPNLFRIQREGAFAPLPTDHPILSPILWTTIATGRIPADHGIGSFVSVRAEDGSKRPVTSSQRHVRALWNIASDAGRRVDTVGWWATWPAEAINGTNVSDRTCFHFLFGQGQAGGDAEDQVVNPPSRRAEILKMVRRPGDIDATTMARFANVPPGELDRPFDFSDDLSHLRWAIATAESYADIGLKLWQEDDPDLMMVYIEATDTVSHLFGHLVGSGPLVGDLEEQRRRYGDTVENMYRYVDAIIGRFLESMDDNTTLIILSDHGFQLGKLHDDPSVTQDMRRVSDRFHAEEGVLYLFGRGVRPGSTPEKPHLVDVAPTVLALLGLPASDEMPGRVLGEALEGIEPPARIASYETSQRAEAVGIQPEDDAEMLAHLEALGYIEGDDEAPIDRGTADMLLSDGRYTEAEHSFRLLAEQHPDDPGIHLNLAVALAQLGRDAEALDELGRTLDLDPTNAKAHFNRGLLLEKSGDREAAAEDYRQAVRYDPEHERARAALERLTGTDLVWKPNGQNEQEAHNLAVRASEAARREDFTAALELLDQAQDLAPDFPMIYEYRANVAYLSGDRKAAVKALERLLELDPGNSRARRNLAKLKQTH